MSHTYATATTGRNTIRRTGVTLPGSTAVSYFYDSGTNGSYDSEASRLSKMTISSVNVARYKYVGFGNAVGVDYDEADVYQHRYGTTTGTYPDLDRFGRAIKSRWTKDLLTDMDFVSVDVGYDENSNPLTTEDQIYDAGFDVKYAIDGMDRVTDADEGTLSSGSITSRTRRQQWTLTQTGNWDNEQLDLNGDGDETDTDEHDDTRTHNAVNELTARDTDSDSTNDYSLTYDAAGNLTDDGETYAYEYDAWYRLRKIKDRGTSAVLSEHQYYGNGFRAGEHYDADEDSDVDSNDPWYWFAYDERWRILGTFVGSDSSPKERFLHHTAGANGYGGSSYIDQVVLRERDANTNWHASSDGTLEERLYYCQNWRHDVVALVTAAGALRERVRYTSYGVPFGIPLGDCDSDGDVDSADQSTLLGAWGATSPRCDLDLSGTIDATDQSIQLGNVGRTQGAYELSGVHSPIGFAGHVSDHSTRALFHARNRVHHSSHGRWLQRDRIEYLDGNSLYQSTQSGPIRYADTYGLFVMEESDCDKVCGPDITNWAINALAMNAFYIVMLKASIGYTDAYLRWLDLVKPNGGWDYKVPMALWQLSCIAPAAAFGTTCPTNCPLSLGLCELCVGHDVFGNINYAFTASMLGMPATVIHGGSHAVQLLTTGGFSPLCDEQWIDAGIAIADCVQSQFSWSQWWVGTAPIDQLVPMVAGCVCGAVSQHASGCTIPCDACPCGPWG